MPKRVFPHPALPHTSVGRPRGSPPRVISSNPSIPVGDLAKEAGFEIGVALFLLGIASHHILFPIHIPRLFSKFGFEAISDAPDKCRGAVDSCRSSGVLILRLPVVSVHTERTFLAGCAEKNS